MKTRLRYQPGYIALIDDDQEKSKEGKHVLAAMKDIDGSGWWQLVDVRLSRYQTPSPYSGSLNNLDFCASFKSVSITDRNFVKSLLREYREYADGTVMWCTFDAIVKGSTTVKGYGPIIEFDQAGYFSRKDGIAYLKEAQTFWDAYTGGDWRIENPLLQPTQTEVSFAVWNMNKEAKARAGNMKRKIVVADLNEADDTRPAPKM